MSMMLQPILAIGFIPPQVALLLTICFVIFLFRRDIRERPNVTGALWLPLIWMFIICTRQTSEWLSLLGLNLGGESLEEGSPFDAGVYFSLIAAAFYVLNKRQVQLSEIIRNNQWLTIFFVYCFLAIFWSDFPFVSFKRWIKVLGHPAMALIVITEPDPQEAISRLMKRCAYVIVPVSIIFIKYFPEYGRGFDPWLGGATNTGITTNKNALGYDCLILGLFFIWHFIQIRRTEKNSARQREFRLTVIFLAMIWWLFSEANSSTALVSLLVGVSIMIMLGSGFVSKRHIGTYVIAGILLCIVAEMSFGISAHLLDWLHKDVTLTDRTILWQDVLKIKINPILGRGFESFWLGSRLDILSRNRSWVPNQAHNGYLETYLNLGLVGLFLLVGLIIATFGKARRELIINFEFGRFSLGFLAAIVLYNWTEASFKTLHPLWFVFYLLTLDYPPTELASLERSPAGHHEEEELAYTEWAEI